jgi:hypothetical protein
MHNEIDATRWWRKERGMSPARLFWIVACADVAIVLALLCKVAIGPLGRYDVFVVIFLVGAVVVLGLIMAVVGLIGKPATYGIGLALVASPLLSLSAQFARDFVTTPSQSALEAGHGYFNRAADRALAVAIVAGDGQKVALLAPAANLNAIGWNRMTFMRLALASGHADPAVVAALLRAGANPDEDQQYLFGSINDGGEATSGAMITGKNERLLRAVIDTGVDLNHWDLEGNPRFLSALRWPEGLAIMLEHGANTEIESKDGNTAIMWAVMLWHWPSIDVLLAHGARLDHVAHDGTSLRDLVLEKVERYRKDRDAEPPQLAALEARLR